jgi:hypothetical protein
MVVSSRCGQRPRRRTNSPEAVGPGDVAYWLLRVHAGRARRRRGHSVKLQHVVQVTSFGCERTSTFWCDVEGDPLVMVETR